MTRKIYILISVAAIVMIPQLLFWWLAPTAAAARLVVYIGSTFLSLAIAVAGGLTYWYSNARKAAAPVIACCCLEIAVVLVAAALLSTDASVRTAVFAQLIEALVCLIVLLPLITGALKQERQGVYVIPSTPSDQPAHDIQECSGHMPNTPPLPHSPHQTPGSKPLPPRNR